MLETHACRNLVRWCRRIGRDLSSIDGWDRRGVLRNKSIVVPGYLETLRCKLIDAVDRGSTTQCSNRFVNTAAVMLPTISGSLVMPARGRFVRDKQKSCCKSDTHQQMSQIMEKQGTRVVSFRTVGPGRCPLGCGFIPMACRQNHIPRPRRQKDQTPEGIHYWRNWESNPEPSPLNKCCEARC
jgi:hypothetical protein